ncbi:MAG: RNA polymerase subunit sigma-24 [Pedosphaera sp. Tous-C6FEB]|nr:MAG: RNA polymerase subunit sigma-24 [Pedosphaera sp. Tous-C6FEB]
MEPPSSLAQGLRPGAFPSTSWSAIWLAREQEPTTALAGLDRLCRKYWLPIVQFIQRHGHNAVAAEELAQQFLTRAVAKSLFTRADPERGRLRALLVTALRNFLIDVQRAQRPPTVPLPEGAGQLSADGQAPDQEFDRRWAEALLERCLTELERDYARRGRLELFLRLEPCLQDRSRQPASHAALAAEFGLTEGAVKAEVYRMRQRFRLLVREEIAATVNTTAELEEELRHLFRAFSS